MRARREENRLSDRNESNLGSTFAQTSQLDLSRNAPSRYFIASSLFPKLVYTSAIQYEGTYCSALLVNILSRVFLASDIRPAAAYACASVASETVVSCDSLTASSTCSMASLNMPFCK